MAVIIMAHRRSREAKRVADILSDGEKQVLLFDTSSPASIPEMSVSISASKPVIQMYNTGSDGTFCEVELDEIEAVWLRGIDYSREDFDPKFDLTQEELTFLFKDYVEYVYNIQSILGRYVPVINSIDDVVASSRKQVQLDIARSYGLEIPKTLVSKDYDILMKWLEENDIDEVAVKPVLMGGYHRRKDGDTEMYRIFTSRLKKEELRTKREAVEASPVTYQEYIEKARELRVTVVGDRVYPVSLTTTPATSERAQLDWRAIEERDELRCEEFDLPSSVKEKCVKVNRALELEIGCIDMIVDKKGRYIFLETNANGNWFWLRRWLPEVEEKISKSVAELLAASS